MHEKISVAEAYEWIKNARESWVEGGFPDEEEFHAVVSDLKPQDFKAPRKPRAPKKSSSSSERSEQDYNMSKCDARIWADSYGAQCSYKKWDGGCLCKAHQTKSDEHEGMLKDGFINQERPTHHYGDESGSVIYWHDVERPKSTKSAKKSAGERCCGQCGEVGHTKRTCPHVEEVSDMSEEELAVLAPSKLKKHARSLGVSFAKLEKAGDAEDVRGAIIELIQAASVKEEEEEDAPKEKVAKKKVEKKKVEKKKVEKKKVEKKKVEEKPVEEKVAEQSTSEDDAAAARLVRQLDMVGKELEEDDSSDSGAGTGLASEPEPDIDLTDSDDDGSDEEEGDGSDEEDDDGSDEEEGDGSIQACNFEGVEYTRDTDDKVFDDEFDEVGDWDGERIVFSKLGLKTHKAALKVM